MGFVELVSGFGWLAQNGVNVVTTPGGEIAPRTAIGTDINGKLMIFEADVCDSPPFLRLILLSFFEALFRLIQPL